MKSGSGKRNLLLAATLISLSATMQMNVPVQAETLAEAIANATTPSYTMNGNFTFGANAGSLAGSGRTFTIDGQNLYYISGDNNYSGIGVSSGQTLTIKDVADFKDFKRTSSDSTSWGGAIFGDSGSDITITGSTFSNNKVITSATADANGGAVYAKGNSLTITDSIFTGNSGISVSEVDGGAVFVKDGNINITGTFTKDGEGNVIDSTTKFVLNKAGDVTDNFNGFGGAIYASSNDSNNVINGVIFDRNQANYRGGALYQGNKKLKSVASYFTGNSVQSSVKNYVEGGAIYNNGIINTLASDFNGNFAKNTSTNGKAYGGAIYNAGFQIDNLSGTFTGNYADGVKGAYGGAIYNSGKIVTIDDATFKNNYVVASDGTQEGAAIYNSGNNSSSGKITTIQNSTFDHNTGAYAITNKGPYAQITNITGNTFIDNTTGAIKNDNGYIQNITGNTFGTKVGDVIHGNKTAILNTNTSTIDNITGTFAYSTDSAIKNYHNAYADNVNTIGSINATFTNNSSENMGGAILNYSGYSSSSTTSEAIHAKITSLTGDFTSNSVTSDENNVYGGAIANYTTSSGYPKVSIGSVAAKTATGFDGNFVEATGNSNSAYGGAIANVKQGVGNIASTKMGNITADFTDNYALSKAGSYGGAIYSYNGGVANNTIGDITGDFTGNFAKATAGDAKGGAIYIQDTNSNTEYSYVTVKGDFDGNYVDSTNLAFGGAIYHANNYESLSVVDSSFTNNEAKSSVFGRSVGGAIFEGLGNLNSGQHVTVIAEGKDVIFSGNKASSGAAIATPYSSLNLVAQNGYDITFQKNNYEGIANPTVSTTGLFIGDDLYLNTYDGSVITVKDDIQVGNLEDFGSTININTNTDVAGTPNKVALEGHIFGKGQSLALNLNRGELYLSGTAAQSLNSGYHFEDTNYQNKADFLTISKLTVGESGATLNLQNNNIDVINLVNGADIKGAVNYLIDVDTTAKTGDLFSSSVITGSPITISAINIINNAQDDAKILVASGGIANYISLATTPLITGGEYEITGSAEGTNYYLNLTALGGFDTINIAVSDSSKTDKKYSLKNQSETGGETVTGDLGNLVGHSLIVNGKNLFLDGDSKQGFVVGTYIDDESETQNQALTLKNMTIKNFTTAVDNAGTLNVENVTFTGNTTDINNTNELNLSGTNTINTITGATGTTNINSGATTFTNSIAQNEIAMKGGRIVVNSGATITGDVKGYEDIPYISENGTRAIYNNGGIISKITGTFKGNSAAQSTTSNVKGGVLYTQNGTVAIDSATFDGNSVKGSSGGSGGAIYSNGTNLTITGTAENPTVFKNNGISKYENSTGSASGGAIYQKNGTLNISNTKFENNVSSFNTKQYLYGGAIYSEATGGNISADFTGNTLSAAAVQGAGNGGGAIYNEGTLTKITGDFTSNAITLQPTSNNEQNGESLGGALYNRGTITNGIDGTFSGNTITTNVKQSDANGGAIANGGTIGNITGDFLNNSVASTNTTYSGSARGGAIYNLSGTIGNITATNATENGFKGNSATKAAGWSAEGLGGAIYNYNGTIGNITANFVNNTATNYGGAIYNIAEDNYKSEIGNIIGNFTGNTASQGSAIYNKVKNDESYINNKLAKIGDITGNFTENVGTVIYNEGYYDFNNFNEIVYAQIGDITGNFAENSASSGNVIFNNYGKIGDITGDFTENTTNNGVINNRGSIDSITANTITHKGFYKNTGGAVRNESSADYHRNATIGNITADFKENSAVSSGGGAIYNTGSNASAKAKIGDITGDFDKNTSKNYGGAIYNNYSIIGAQNNLGEFTGTAIIGDFTYNQVDNNSVYNSIGGAIANENSSAIGNIQGNFENNSIIDSRYKAMGGAIANRTSSTIGNITGNFNANSISYNPIFDTDTFEAQHYGNSSLGGAIYNDSTSTIGTLTGDFNGNWAKGHVAEDDTTTVFAAAGGAIFNEGTLGTITGDIKNNYALGHSHHGVYGGAIYTTTGLNLVDSDITGNYVTTQSASATDLKGGAIYTTDGINITASTKDISVSGNKGTEQGAAIYNTSENNAVVLNATGGNITFENNNLTGLANGSGVGIYSAGGLTLNAADGKYIAINDALNITGNTTLNGKLKLGDNAVETLANTTSKFIAQGGALDIANGAIDTMTFANAVDIQNAINLGIDVDAASSTSILADYITASITDGNTSKISISNVNFIHDLEDDFSVDIATGTIGSLIKTATTVDIDGTTSDYDVEYVFNNNVGTLNFSLITYDGINNAVIATDKENKKYALRANEHVTDALGALVGTSLTVNGKSKTLYGATTGAPSVKLGGFEIANSQTLTLNNMTVRDFTTAVDNAGTLNVENVTFTNNSTADINNTGTANIINSDVAKIVNSSTVNVTDSTIRNIKNTGVLNISDTDGTPVYMLLITDNETPEGITNITGGYTQFVGNVTQNTINLKGGNLTLPNNTTVNANIVADGTVDKTGYLNNFSSGSTINGTISGTFKGNDETALSNVGTIGNVTSNFVNNTHSGSSDIMGGAIYNTGTMGTISGNFTGNSATSTSGDAKGGAIYQQGGTLTISGATFGGSAAGQGNSATATASGKHGYGGAIYLDSGTMTVNDSAFEKNSATQGGAIYQNSGSITITDSTFKNNTGNAGGAIYQKAGTLSINGSTYDNSGNIWQESGTLSITDSNFTNTDVISRLGSNVTISGSTFDNSSVHFIGKGNETSAINQNTFSIVNSTIENIPDNSFNAYALSVVGGDVTIDGVNIINNTYAKAIKSESAAQGPGDNTHYSKINIIAQAADVNITGNKYGINVIGWGNDPSLHTTLSLYAKDHDILISNNSEYGIYYSDDYGVLTLNADTGHNITINDAVSSTTGMTVNAGGTHAGTVALNGALTLGDVISVGGGTLELGSTAVTSLNKAISTNSGTVKLTGGTLTQAIAGNTTVSGSDVTLGTNGSLVNATVANGAKLTSQASQFTTMNNLGTLLLSGTLDKAISGTGETKINQTLTFAEGENPAKASIAGTLNMNSGTLNMVEEETPAYTNYTVGTLKGSGNLAIDFDGTNTDKLTITTADETPITVTLTALNGFTKGQDAVSAKTILEGASNITLAISDTLRTAYNETTHEDVYHTDTIVSNANWDTEFKNRYFDKETGKQLVVNNDTANKTLEYKYTVEEHEDATKDISLGDTLALVNQKVDTTRTFTTDSATAVYNVNSALGNTGVGKITVQGVKSGDDISTLNMAGNTGFVVGTGAEVELNTVKVTNTANSEGSLINNTAGTATLNNVEIASNSVNVISSSGTLGVTNSTVNAGVNNDGTMNLNGTNQIASVEGSNGTANVQTGTTTVGSIFQKLISIVSGGKLASNGDVTATNGITNATAEGLSVANGTLTGNVTGEGSTKFSGTSSIANGSVVGQAITVVDGKLTTLANGLGGAVTNAVENGLELTGGELTKAISGDGTTLINTANNVIIGDGGSIAQVIAVQSGTLKTGVNGFTQNITSNSGIVELTGTGTLTQTIAGNITVSGSGITNSGSLANVTIADGGVLTSNANGISGTINNGGTLKLSGTLNKAISGNGETIANADLTLGTSASVTGTLNANSKALIMSGDSAATQTNVGTLKGAGTLSVDVINNSGTIVSDSIKATTYDNSIAFVVNNMTGFDDVVNGLTLSTTTGENVGFNLNVLNGYEGNGLTIADAYTTAYHNVGKNVDRAQTDELTSTANWTDQFGESTWQDQYNQTLTVSNGTIAYNIVKTGETAHVYEEGDTLQMLNTASQFGTTERKFVTTDASATYDVSTNLGTTAAGTMTVKGATDGTNTSTIDMNGKTGFVVSNAGTTLNLDTVNITGAKAEDSSLINNSQGTVNINNVTVANNANNVITNNNEMNLTGTNTINAGVNGANGTTNVKSGTSIIDRIAQKVVEIFGGSKLETETIAATDGVANAGDLAITGDANTSNITGAGTTEFTNNVNNTGDISQGTVKVADGKTLTTTGDITTDNLTNGGTVTLNSADTSLTIKGGTAETPTTIGGTINGTGSTVIEGNAQNNGTIASAVEIATSGKLSTNASNVTGAVTNNATDGLTLTGGTIQNAINGTGSTVIAGTVSNSGDKSIDNAVTIASGSLTTDASQIKQAVTNNVNDGLNLTGGNLASNISGTGSTVISGNVTNNDGKSLGTDMTVNGGASITTNANNIGGDITNSGNVQLTGGTLAKDITGGTTQIAGDVINSANIGGTTNITSGSLDNSNGNIANATVGAGTSLTSNADNVSGTVNVTGDYNVTGGAIAGAITGTGNTNINADTEVKAAVSSNINVADGKTLNVNPTSGNIASAVSVALGDGSKLDISGGTADSLNNISVASGKTANLAMDWGDSIGTNNIAGNLNVSDIDLTGTTTSTPASYNMATGSNIANVAINENVNLKTNETSFNQVKYNSTTGSFTGAKNNLVQAVNTTEDGESAIYSMSGDEPAGTLGAGVLDGGKLIVQGNGNTISGYGIEVGDGTHNAILTIKDANMKNITGDALLVKGGNTATVMAENSDIEISGATGNAITLNKDANGNSTVNINGGSHTVTIENDIISDDSGNTINFNSGTINFNGKFDPAAAVVGGATVNRGGDDDGIDWTVTSGTLNYLQDSYLNRATNTMNLNGGTLNTINGVVTDFALGGFTLSNDSNFYADVDLAAGKMDNFISTPTTYTGGTLHVAGLNLISDATADNTSIPFANSTLAGHVDYTGAQGLTALSPIYKYNVGYNSSNGNFDFARYNSGGYDGLNPAIMAAPVAAQMGGYLTQLNSYDEAFRNMDMYMLMTAQQRQALKNKNKIASLDGGILYDQTLMRQERAEGWFRPFATFEKVPLKNGPKVENIAYGTYMGGESEMYDLGHGWDGIWGAYVGYNGSHQNYDGVSIYQNGGTLGVLGMAYKGNFFTGLTINAGASGVEASTMYGNEDFAMLMAGIASKTGYNWELFNGKFIIQPSMLMSYSFVNTFDYKNAAGVNVDSDPLHAIQLQPEIKFIGNLKNGWQPYASVAMVWNIMDDTKFKANDVSLPELSVKPYVKYGVGVRKTWGERLTGFFQTYLTNGGRNGVGLQAGFTWAFGGGKDKKADEKKIQKSLNKTPELKKTEIVLNGKKVQ